RDPVLAEELPARDEIARRAHLELRQILVARLREAVIAAHPQQPLDAERPVGVQRVLVAREDLVPIRRDVRTDPVVALAHVAECKLAVLTALLEAEAEAIARAVDEAEIRRHVADVV